MEHTCYNEPARTQAAATAATRTANVDPCQVETQRWKIQQKGNTMD